MKRKERREIEETTNGELVVAVGIEALPDVEDPLLAGVGVGHARQPRLARDVRLVAVLLRPVRNHVQELLLARLVLLRVYCRTTPQSSHHSNPHTKTQLHKPLKRSQNSSQLLMGHRFFSSSPHQYSSVPAGALLAAAVPFVCLFPMAPH